MGARSFKALGAGDEARELCRAPWSISIARVSKPSVRAMRLVSAVAHLYEAVAVLFQSPRCGR